MDNDAMITTLIGGSYHDKVDTKDLTQSEWAELVKQRDNYTCIFSNNDLYRDHSTDLEAHHLIPKSKGGENIVSNGITVCKNCHSQFLIETEQRYYTKVLIRFKNTIRILLQNIFNQPRTQKYYDILKFLTNSDTFRPGQLEALKVLGSGSSLIFVAPTSLGKSIIYQTYGLYEQSQMLVIAPLLALQRDQVQNLWKKWIPATLINSSLEIDEKDKRLNNIKRGFYSFVFAHPKQFIAKSEAGNKFYLKTQNELLHAPFSTLCVDEAHVIDTWGRSFVEEYEKLHLIRKHLNYPQTILLSASLTKKQQEKISDELFKKNEKLTIIVRGFYRKEIELFVSKFHTGGGTTSTREDFVKNILRNNQGKKTLIFANTKNQVIDLVSYLKLNKFDAYGFHSDVEEDIKNNIQDRFAGKIKPEINILVSTSAFGMGINIPNIRVGIHYSLPFNLNDYYQQFGRLGRDGKLSKAYLLYDANESTGLVDFINGKQLEGIIDGEKKKMLTSAFQEERRELLDYVDCRDKWEYILNYFGDTEAGSIKAPYIILAIKISVFALSLGVFIALFLL